MKKLILLAFIIGSLASCQCGSSTPCVKKNCDDFKTQEEAQKVDHDGVACESLPKEK